MHKPELLGRLAKWAIEINGYDIKYWPWIIIKSQILVEFVANFTPALIPYVKRELLLYTRIMLYSSYLLRNLYPQNLD